MFTRATMLREVLLLICLASLSSGAAAQKVPGITNTGTWKYATEQDLMKATVYRATYSNLTSSLSLQCGGLGGMYVSMNIGYTSGLLPGRLDVKFYFTKGGKLFPARRPLTVTGPSDAENTIKFERQMSLSLADAFVLFDQVKVTVSDPNKIVPEMQATFPLTGAADPVRQIYQNCEELKGLPAPGTKPIWNILDELERP